ncbi:transporter [Edaphobacter acidisoli]|uniref:Transporter n=2 Tax=Edaphobacter acidisoli TaxID=2040573 RepID=A0A916RZ03_9BACT|nr:transporter [Edaphobacter acidisoli]
MNLGDQLNIETPELVDIRFSVSGIGSRCLAILVDTLIQVAVQIFILLLLILLGVTFSKISTAASDKWIIAGVVLVYFALYWGYFSLFEYFWNGQTPGKHLFKIRVVKDTGRQITFFEALARNLLRIIDSLPSFYLVGVISMMCNKQQKRLGDFVAGTIVVHERQEDQPLLGHNSRMLTAGLYQQPVSEPPLQSPAGSALIQGDAIGRLKAPDLQMIEAFTARALDLDMDVRARMADRVANQIAGKMNYPIPEGTNPERFLEAVAYAMRAQSRF